MQKNFNIGVNLDIYELIWFKVRVIINTIELYIMVQV